MLATAGVTGARRSHGLVASPTWTRALTLDRVNAISCSDDMTPSLQDGYRWIMAYSHVTHAYVGTGYTNTRARAMR